MLPTPGSPNKACKEIGKKLRLTNDAFHIINTKLLMYLAAKRKTNKN